MPLNWYRPCFDAVKSKLLFFSSVLTIKRIACESILFDIFLHSVKKNNKTDNKPGMVVWGYQVKVQNSLKQY